MGDNNDAEIERLRAEIEERQNRLMELLYGNRFGIVTLALPDNTLVQVRAWTGTVTTSSS